MATPLITFKAGQCEYDAERGSTVKPDATPGYVYITQEDDIHHFCWRPRSAPHTEPTLDLLMFPTDATFQPYRPANVKTAIAGRLYVLKFSSSNGRHFFWLQSSTKSSDPSEFSSRDLKIGEIVNSILQGEEIDVSSELRNLPHGGGTGGDNSDEDDDDEEDDEEDDDTAMEDADGPGSGGSLHRAASGGAGAGATGGDIREEGEESREGGADGGRAIPPSTGTESNSTQAAVANFLRSLQGSNLSSSPSTSQSTSKAAGLDQPLTTLPDLLSTNTTLALLPSLSPATLDKLIAHLPPQILLLSSGLSPSEINQPSSSTADETDSETLSAISLSLSPAHKRALLARILRTPQLTQALASLTHALRDGGLPMIADALGIPLSVPGTGTTGGDAVGAFVAGVKAVVERDGLGDQDQDQDDEEEDGADEEMHEA